MLQRWLMTVFWMLAEAWSARRDTRVRFLKLQVELLRQKMPGNRVILSPEERARLLKLGAGQYNPDEAWVMQQARNVTMWLDDEGIEATHLIHDLDTKFTGSFDHVFKTAGVEIVKTPFQATIANCYAESWIGTLKRECLNHFACFGLKHFDHIVQTYTDYYNRLRPHQGKDNRPLTMNNSPIPIRATEEVGAVQRHELLGGLLSHYERKAA